MKHVSQDFEKFYFDRGQMGVIILYNISIEVGKCVILITNNYEFTVRDTVKVWRSWRLTKKKNRNIHLSYVELFPDWSRL